MSKWQIKEEIIKKEITAKSKLNSNRFPTSINVKVNESRYKQYNNWHNQLRKDF